MEKLVEIHEQNLRAPHLGSSQSVEMDPEVEENLRALGYVGGDSGAVSTPVFPAPLRVIDMEPYGFLGSEQNLSEYRSALDLSADEFSAATKQLLYGWQKKPSERRMRMSRKAGIRLKREAGHAGHSEWRIRGFVPSPLEPSSPVELEIRLDGVEEHHETISSRGFFEASGSLPETSRPFLRMDLTCSRSPLAARHGALDEMAPCLLLSSIAIE